MNYIIKDEKFACGYHGDYGQMEVFFRLNQYPDIPEGHTLVRAYAGLYQNDWRSGVDNKYDGSAILYMQANTENKTLDSNLRWGNKTEVRPGAGLCRGQLSYD